MVTHLKSKVYPDLYFSIGAVPKQKKTTYDKNYDRDYSEQFNSCVKVSQEYGRAKYDEISWLEGQIETHNRFISSLKSSQKGIRHGTNGITSYGKRTVKGAAALMEKKYGKSRLGFGTLTIPGYSANQIKILTSRWADVTRVFFQKLKREFEKVGCSNEIIAVTEIQPDRFYEQGIIAPHIHFVYVCREKKGAPFYVSSDLFRYFWKGTLRNIVGRFNDETGREVTFGASLDTQVVRDSAASYLGKYMTKGGKVIEDIWSQDRQNELPHSWWSISNCLRKRYKSSIKKIHPEALELLFYKTEQALQRDIIRWYQEIYVQMGDESRLVGVVGYFSNAKMLKLCVQQDIHVCV